MTEPADRTVAVEVTIAAPPEVVWDALRDRSQVRHWHGSASDGVKERGWGGSVQTSRAAMSAAPATTPFLIRMEFFSLRIAYCAQLWR